MINHPIFRNITRSLILVIVSFRGLAIGASLLLLLATKRHPKLGADLRVVTYPNNTCVRNFSNLTSFDTYQLPFYCSNGYYVYY